MAHHASHQGPLLNNAEQNIGNSAVLLPQAGNSGVCIPQSNAVRLLDLAGDSKLGQTTSVVFTVSRILQGADNPNPGLPGPVTGIIDFGNGGRDTELEFDVPVGPFFGNINQASSAIQPRDGHQIVTVPTGVLRAYVRYDNLLLAPVLGTSPYPKSHAEISGAPIIGPGGPLLVTLNVSPTPPYNTVIPPEPVLTKAMASYFSRPRSKVYKTLYLYCTYETAGVSPLPVGIQVGTPTISTVGIYAGTNFWALPAFTKKVKVLRFPDTTGLTVLLHNGIRPVDYIVIPGGPTAPEIDIEGDVNIIGISSGSDYVTFLALQCEIGI
jgi:hypothetical protein